MAILPLNATNTSLVCYTPAMTTTNGVWKGDDPLEYSLPLFVLQLTLVVLATRFFVFLLKPFHQPRVIGQIMGGLLLGPSVLGRYEKFGNKVFPLKSVIVIETVANIGLIFFMFLVGLEMDVSVVKRTGKKVIFIAVAGMILPFAVAAGLSLVINDKFSHVGQGCYILFLGVALSVTAFPVLVRLLADLKLVNTELGRLALSTSLVNDMWAWVLLALAIALSERKHSSWASLWVVMSSIAFVAISFLFIRPALSWLIDRNREGQPFTDFQICVVLTGVMISAFITDALGTHAVFGAFVYGLVLPNGPLGAVIIEKLEDFVSGLLLPLFFAISGLKTNIHLIKGSHGWAAVALVIPLACLGKVAGTLLVSLLFQIPTREGVILGLLMNSKGLVEIIVINVAREQKVFGDKIFSIMIIVTLIMSAVISPIVTAIYKPRRRLIPYKKRTIQNSRHDAELRVLVCIHVPRNVPTIINLLEATRPTKKSPICACVLHLVELTGRASAMLVVHADMKSGRPALNKTQAQADHIITAFKNFEENVDCVSVQPSTAVSPYSTMHEDICSLAEEKRVSLIIIPFHKQQTIDGQMQDTNPAYRLVNHNLLQTCPCSVGILVDRGLNGSSRLLTGKQACHHVAVLFFGGPDDREALAYGWRMSTDPRVLLTVVHFVPSRDIAAEQDYNEVLRTSKPVEPENDRRLDEDYINDFKMIATYDESVVYVEIVVSNGEEIVGEIRSMKNAHDLFIVGSGQETSSPLLEGLTDWSECPELGAIGDILASSDFETTASVLVMHQYIGEGPEGQNVYVTEKPWQTSEQFQNSMMRHAGRYGPMPVPLHMGSPGQY